MIYFKGADTAHNIKELLENGFYKNTLFQATYKDPEYRILQCKVARRSFPDLLEICRTYFPKTTESDLARLLSIDYNSFYCKDIGRLVFLNEKTYCKIAYSFDSRMSTLYDENFEDSQGNSYNKILQKII